MSKLHPMLRSWLLFTLFVMSATLCRVGYASESPQSGHRYKIIRPVYLMATYNSINNRQISRETARAYLHTTRYYDSSWVAFQGEVPVGTIMTIVTPTSKVWHLPFFAKRYFVRLAPDPSQGLDVVLELDRGIEGSLDGLNPEIFLSVK